MSTFRNGAQGGPYENGQRAGRSAPPGHSGATRQRKEPDEAAPHPLEPLLAQLAKVRAFALHYVEAQKDSLRASVRRLVMQLIIGIGAGIAAVTVIVASTVLLLQGLAQLISWVAGGRAWVGNLAIGGGMLLLIAIATAIVLVRQSRRARNQTIRKYENRHHAQRTKFGTDVSHRAAG